MKTKQPNTNIEVIANYVEMPNACWNFKRHIVKIKKANGDTEVFFGLNQKHVEQYLASFQN